MSATESVRPGETVAEAWTAAPGTDLYGRAAVPRVITVGVDGSPGDRHALTWAAAAARAHGMGLRLVHAHPHRFDTAVTERVHAAEGSARELAPDLQIRVVVATGEVDHVLIEQSASSAMLVLAPHPERPLEGFSTQHSTMVAAASRCPVITVPRLSWRRSDGHGPVVVGVDGTAASEPPLAFAFAHAAATGADLLALHSWQDDASGEPDGRTGPGLVDDALFAAQDRVLAERLAGWQATYPDVRIRREVVHGRAARVLLAHASTARLLVVGSTGRSGLTGLLHGSTSQSVLYQAPCPLAVVRAPGPVPG